MAVGALRSRAVRACINNDSGVDITDVDDGFEYCLAKVQQSFIKRDVFLATADLCRALALLFLIGVVPLWRVVRISTSSHAKDYFDFICGVALLFTLAVLSWRRMVRFRDFTEKPVFTTYLAEASKSKSDSAKA